MSAARRVEYVCGPAGYARIAFTYFVQPVGGGPIKIGSSVCPESRLDGMRGNSPVELAIIGVCEGGEKLERELHRRFAHLRLHCEWFAPGPDLVRFIRDHARPLIERPRLGSRPVRRRGHIQFETRVVDANRGD